MTNVIGNSFMKFYAVFTLIKEFEVSNSGISSWKKVPISNLGSGIAGMIPCFKTRKAAEAFSKDYNNCPVVEMRQDKLKRETE